MSIYLCVMSDDFGMHPAINEGIVQAFVDGILTDANLMAPCPAFGEAVRLALAHQIPVGFHATLTCDWDRYHWGPLTGARSLSTREGWLKDRVGKAWKRAKDEEVVAELRAQCEAITAQGISITHLSFHMGTDRRGRFFRALSQLSPEHLRPLRFPKPDAKGLLQAYQWESVFCSSARYMDYKRRKALLKSWLRHLTPGYHLWTVHAAIDHPSLYDLCSGDFHAVRWASLYRALDQALLLDNEIKELIEARGIELIPVTQAPVGDI